MGVPDHLLRHPTVAAIDSLSKHFNLPNTKHMQDWGIEVADADRAIEYLEGYESLDLSDDEKFVLMWTILQSFQDLQSSLDQDVHWQRVLFHLDAEIDIHISTVWYWAVPDAESHQEIWTISLFMREILERHRKNFESTIADSSSNGAT
jgi:hypothetical protein